MISAESSTTIHRPIADVYAYVADQTNKPQWHTGIREIRPTEDAQGAVGSMWIVTVKVLGREYTEQITALEPNRRIQLATVEGPIRPTTTYRFESADDRTRISRHVDIPVGRCTRFFRPLLRRVADRRNASFVENIKAILEG